MLEGKRIAFVGAGNMASALIEGLLSAGTYAPQNISASDVRQDALAELREKHRIATNASNLGVVTDADIIVLCVKPQVLPDVLSELRPGLRNDALVLSIAAGVPSAAIEAALSSSRPSPRVVRAMPNTPALVAAGATAIAAGQNATERDLELAERVFGSVGIVVRVDESAMDAVTALSGSGPAYVFLLVEALAHAGAQAGLAPEIAAALAAQTVYGAGKLLHAQGEAPAELRRRVTSPGGTTQAGIERLEAGGLRALVDAAVAAAAARGKELGEEAARKARKPGS